MSKVFKIEYRPVSEIANSPLMCVWHGCKAAYQGDQPYGWVNLITYSSKDPCFNFLDIPPKDLHHDAVLCPKHVRKLDGLLKDCGRELLRAVRPIEGAN